MTTTEGAPRSGATATDDVLAELQPWLDANWDPGLTLRAWWERLGLSGWAKPDWPAEWYGRGLTAAQAADVDRAIRAHGAVPAPTGFSANMAGPILLAYGTDEQRERYLRGIVTGTEAFCQLFSEPNAGSDLAGLQTRADFDGSHWIANGQKVWSSHAELADHALLVARTDPTVSKHAGLSYFIVAMRQPGVDVRPLRELTGRAYFNEVFLDDARIDPGDLVGGEGNGWAVASATLAFERAWSSSRIEGEHPPEVGGPAGNLDRLAAEFIPGIHNRTDDDRAVVTSPFERLAQLAATNGARERPVVRDALVRLHTLERLNALTYGRARALEASGSELPGSANLGKMAQNHAARLQRDLTFEILGAPGMLYTYEEGAERTLVGEAMFSLALPIYGGTDQIQRNIVGERVLGLPREPGPDKNTPFKDLLKN